MENPIPGSTLIIRRAEKDDQIPLEEITGLTFVGAAYDALYGRIHSNMREIFVEFIQKKLLVNLHFFFDKPTTKEDLGVDGVYGIFTILKNYFREEIKWKEKIVVSPCPEKPHDIVRKPPNIGVCIFRRYESEFSGKEIHPNLFEMPHPYKGIDINPLYRKKD